MPDLKLARLPDRTPVKLGISVTPGLADDLAAYAAAYGREEALADLIPAMLAAFLESDRVFAKGRKQGASTLVG